MSKSLIPSERIEGKIFLIRGMKVMLDRDLAELYGVPTAQLTRQVRRNIDRFPKEFMCQLTKQEFAGLKCHFGTSSWGGTRKLPYVFTEHGVLMLSSVLSSKRAIQVNIQIMKTFTKLREMIMSHKDLKNKIEAMERKFKDHDQKFQIVFEAIKKLLQPPLEEKTQLPRQMITASLTTSTLRGRYDA